MSSCALCKHSVNTTWLKNGRRQWSAGIAGQPVGSVHGRCRIHRAEILRLRGSLSDAEKEALLACEELRPYLRRELGWPLSELGRIRLRIGDISGAQEVLLAANAAGWDAQPGLALVQLAHGNVAFAAESIRDALAHPLNVPSKELPPNTELRRAPLLEAQVEIEVAAGNLDRARAAAEELGRVAGLFESKALSAIAIFAHGRVRLAEGDAAGARYEFEAAANLWNEVGAPFETALARMGVGDAYRAEQKEQHALTEFRAARSVFERIGAKLEAARAELACSDDRANDSGGAAATIQPPPVDLTALFSQEYLFRRDGDIWSVTFEGHTVRLRDQKGLHYLARLVADPGREFHVLDLVRGDMAEPEKRSWAAEPQLGVSSGVGRSPVA